MAITEHILLLRANNAYPNTSLCAFCEYDNWFVGTADILTDLLHQVVLLCPSCGLVPSDVFTRALQTTGAMALVCTKFYMNHLKMVGC